MYEGRASGAHRTEAGAAKAALKRRSRHLITCERSDKLWSIVDGAHARPGGMQMVNDVRGTGRSPNVKIHPDREVAVAAGAVIVPLTSSMSADEMAAAELLTDYGQRFWDALG